MVEPKELSFAPLSGERSWSKRENLNRNREWKIENKCKCTGKE